MFRELFERCAHEIRIAVGIDALLEVDDLALVVERVDVARTLPAAALAQLVGDLVGITPVGGIEVDVVGNQEFAGADRDCAGLAVEFSRPEVRFPFRPGQLFRQAFVFT